MDRVRLKILNLDQDHIIMDWNLNRQDRRLVLQKGEKLQEGQSFLGQGNMLKVDLFLQVRNMVLEIKLNLMPLLIKSQDQDNMKSLVKVIQ